MQDADFTYNLKILVVGYGSIGKRHISNLTNTSNKNTIPNSKHKININHKWRFRSTTHSQTSYKITHLIGSVIQSLNTTGVGGLLAFVI